MTYIYQDSFLIGPIDDHIKFGRADHWNTESEKEHQESEDAYLTHLSTLPRYPVQGEHKWINGQEVGEGEFGFLERCYVDYATMGENDCVYTEDKPCKCCAAIPIHKEQTKPEQVKDKDDCRRHKKELFGQTDMKVIAEAIGDLHYEVLHDLFARLCEKFELDATNDSIGGKRELSRELFEASEICDQLTIPLYKAWKISKPFMTTNQ